MTILAGLYLFLGTSPAFAANLYWVASPGSTNTNTASNWKLSDPTECGSGDASAAPSTGDVAIFDADCDTVATVAGSFSVGGVNMNSGYTGTVTQNAITITIGSSGWTQADGTFTGNSDGSTANITIGSGGDFNLTGGIFTSTNDTLTVNDDFTVDGGTFTHNSGTTYFQASADNAQTITGSFTASALTFYGPACASYTVTIASGTTITANGTLTFDYGGCGGTVLVNGPGGISAKGNITVLTDGWTGSAVITVNGTGDQTLTGISNFPTNYGRVPPMTIDKSSGSVTLTNTMAVTDDFTVTNLQDSTLGGTGTLGIYPAADAALTITGSFTTPGLYFFNNSNNDKNITIASGTTITVTGATTFNDTGCCVNLRDINGPGAISAQGDITSLNNGWSGSAVITVNGSGTQTFTGVSNFPTAYGAVPAMTINKSSGSITLTNTIAASDDFTVTNLPDSTIGGSGTLAIYPSPASDNAVTITGSFTTPGLYFHNNSNDNKTITIASGTTITVAGTTTFNDTGCCANRQINGGGISAQGAITSSNNGWTGSTTVTLSGSSNQTITASGTNFPTGTVTFNKSGGTITLAAAWSINSSGQDLLVAGGSTQTLTGAYTLTVNDSTTISGSLTQGTSTISSASFTVSAGGTWTNQSTGDITVGSGGVSNSGTINFDGTQFGCGDADAIAISSSSGGSARTWTGKGVYTMYDITISDQTDLTTTSKSGRMAAYSSTNSSNSNFTIVSTCPSPPLLYWTLDEATGTTANDSSSNNLDGTVSDNTNWRNEDLCTEGKCLYFDGTNNDNVTKADDSKLDFGATDNFTIQAWVKRNGASSAINYIASKHDVTDDTEDGGYKLWMDSDGDLCFGIDDDITWGPDILACSTNANFDDDKWHLVTGVRDQTGTDKIYLYVDGVEKSGGGTSDTTSDTLANSNAFYAGVDRDGTSNEWLGFMDEVKVYDYARSANQVKTDYIAGAKNAGARPGTATALGAKTEAWLSDGLVGYWKMDESAANSCTGAVNDSCDSSGNGNDGAWTGNTANTAGKFGNGVALDGTGDYVNVADNAALDLSTGLTLATWVKHTSGISSTDEQIISKYDADGSDDGAYAIDYRSDESLRFYFGNSAGNSYSGAVQTAASVFADTNWHFVVASYDTGTAKIYVDGVEKSTTTDGTVPTSLRQNTLDLKIGGRTDNGAPDRYWNGRIDDVRIYNRALSPKEVSDLYNFAPGPVGYWNFEEKVFGDSKTVADISGNSYSGTTNDGANNTGMDCSKSGKYGGGCYFDGTDDNISISGSALDVTTFTVSSWAKWESTPASGDNRFIFNKSDPGSNANWYLWLDSNGSISGSGNSELIYGFRNSAGTAFKDHFHAFSPTGGTWYYFSVVNTGSLIQLYINGVLVDSESETDAPNTTAVQTTYIGSQRGGGFHFLGILDDVRIYNYARSAKQIVSDMNAGHPAVGTPVSSAVAHWKFDEGYLTTANDSTPNDNDLTLSSASWTNSGKFGKAFNGATNLRLSRSDDADLDFAATDDFTISGWFKSDSATNPSANEYLVEKGGNITTDAVGYAVYTSSSSDGLICFGIDDDATTFPEDSVCSASDFYDNTWHHIVATKTSSRLDLYIDGKPNGTPDTSISATGTLENAATFYLGDTNGTDGTDEFLGDLDEVKIYRFALTADEAKIEYNKGSSMVLGAAGNSSTYQPQAANQEYCIPGDTSCAAPLVELKLDEGSGTTAYDTSGNGNNGDLTNSPTWTNGKIGKAVNFSATNSYIDLPESTATVKNKTAATIEAWVKFNTLPATDKEIYQELQAGSITYRLALVIDVQGAYCTANAFTFFTDDDNAYPSDVQICSTTIATAGKWYHLVGVADTVNDSHKFYVNGKLEATSTTAQGTYPNTNSAFTAVGNNNATLNAIVDNVRLFDYARTPAQVAWDYNRGKPIAHWKFDECQGSTVYDSSGNNNTGTWSGTGGGSQTAAGTCTSSGAWYNGVSGKRNYSLNFDGTDDYVNIPYSSSLAIGTSDYTISAWIYRTADADSTAWETIVGRDTCGGTWKGPILMINLGGSTTCSPNTAGLACTGDDGTGNMAASTTDFTAAGNMNRWMHLAGMRDGTNLRIYVNGVLENTVSTTSTNIDQNLPLTIGVREDPGVCTADQEFEGKIDDVRIYNYALTASQIKDIMNDGAVRFGPSTGAP